VSDPSNEYRLPRTVIPSRYRITLTPDLEAATFTGSENITVEVHEPAKEIVLNSEEINITSVTLRQGRSTQKGRVALDAERQRATITLDRPARIGKAELDIEFTGILNDQLVGFYKSTFIASASRSPPHNSRPPTPAEHSPVGTNQT
jgi:aminopeptidase N